MRLSFRLLELAPPADSTAPHYRFASDHSASDPHIVRMLSAIRNASHVSESEEATRWRQERYHVRLSERGWGLLLGWLQGGGLAGSIEGTEARGRDRVLAIINERVKVDGEFCCLSLALTTLTILSSQPSPVLPPRLPPTLVSPPTSAPKPPSKPSTNLSSAPPL